MAYSTHTFCRICEPNCPLIADVDDHGAVVALSPDHDHPSGGVACHKGLSYLELHNDPDRVNWPQRRTNAKSEARGVFEETGWDEALAEIGQRIRAIRDEHGPNSVAVYFGNPLAFHASAMVMLGAFQDSLNTKMRFGANTQDAANKVAACGAIYGCAEAIMIPDIYHTDYLLCLGTNPKVSRWTAFSAPNNWDVVKAIVRRGGKVRFVNPRKIESSTGDTGPTILIRPGTDAYFLAAILNEIERKTGFGHDLVTRFGRNVDGLRDFVQRYPIERVTQVTGIDADTIRTVAAEILAARSAAVYMSTGVSQSRQGLICAWLVEMLNFVTGNLGREGGTFRSDGLFDHFPPVQGVVEVETSLGRLTMPDPPGYNLMPGALLGNLIDSGDVRAMFVVNGNPLLSMGGGGAARKAYAKLDLLVSIDIFRNATGELGDFVLPGTDWLERPDINLLALGLQAIPYVQYVDAVTPPAAGRRNEWWILARLLQEMGLESPLDEMPDEMTGESTLAGLLAASGLTIEALRQAPSQSAMLAPSPRDSLYERCLKHPDGKIDCMPASFISSGLVDRCEQIFVEMAQTDSNQLALISLRTPYLHNSWFNNSALFRRGKNAENPLHMTEADAASRGLFGGDAVRVASEFGDIETRVLIDDDLCAGTVAMSHGFGQAKTFSLRVAQRNAGANCNALMPVGLESYEQISNMSWLSGVPVTVERR